MTTHTGTAADIQARRLAAEEWASTWTHGLGTLAAGAGGAVLVALAIRTGDPWRVVAAAVFSTGLVLLYAMSTLYHASAHPPAKARYKVLDHCAIYLLIAATYTPFTLVPLRGPLGWRLFAAVWSLAAIGMVFKLFFAGRFKLLSTLVYIAMGWLVLVAIKPVMAALDGWTFGWLLAGGIAYTLGTVFYHRPALRYSHAVWHLFVIAGSTCHYLAILPLVGAEG